VFKDVIKVNAFKDPKARPRLPPPREHGRATAAACQTPSPPRVTLFCQLTTFHFGGTQVDGVELYISDFERSRLRAPLRARL